MSRKTTHDKDIATRWFNETRQLVRKAGAMRSSEVDISVSDWQNVHDRLFDFRVKYASSAITRAASAPSSGITRYRELVFGKCTASTQFKLTKPQIYLQDVFGNSSSRAMLLFHDVGTGKTCTAIRIAEEMHDRNPLTRVMVVVPPNLKETFKRELFEPSLIGSGGKISGRKCVMSKYVSYAKHVAESLGRANDVGYMRSLAASYVSQIYSVQTQTDFVNIVKIFKGSTLSLESFFNNTLIIVDEVHSTSDKYIRSRDISDAISTVARIPSVRILLMSATPLYDKPEEAIWLLNLLARSSDLPPVTAGDVFAWLGDNETVSVRPDIIREISRRCVSRAKVDVFDFARVVPPLPISKAHIRESVMSSKQTAEVLRLWTKSNIAGEESRRFSIAAGSASNIMFSIGTTLSSNFEIILKKGPKSNAQKSFKYRAGMVPFLSEPHLSEHSAKMSTIVRELSEPSANQISFVYSSYVEYGILPLALALESNGWCRHGGPNLLLQTEGTNVPINGYRYVLFTGDNELSQQSDWGNILKYVNQPDNADGSLVRAILGTSVLSEGISLANVRHVHILEPWFNLQRIRQVVGRAVRKGSHSNLPVEERVVRISIHSATCNSGCKGDKNSKILSPDQIRMKISTEKQRLISDIERIMEENSIETVLKPSQTESREQSAVLLDMDRVYLDLRELLSKALNRFQMSKNVRYRVVTTGELTDVMRTESKCDDYDEAIVSYVARRMADESFYKLGQPRIRYACPYYIVYAASERIDAVPLNVPIRLAQVLSEDTPLSPKYESNILKRAEGLIAYTNIVLNIKATSDIAPYVIDMWIDQQDRVAIRELIGFALGSMSSDSPMLHSLVFGGYIQLDGEDSIVAYTGDSVFVQIEHPPASLLQVLRKLSPESKKEIAREVSVARGIHKSDLDIGFLSRSAKGFSSQFRVANRRTRQSGFVCIDYQKNYKEFVDYIFEQTGYRVEKSIKKKDICTIYELALRKSGRFVRPPVYEKVFVSRQRAHVVKHEQHDNTKNSVRR